MKLFFYLIFIHYQYSEQLYKKNPVWVKDVQISDVKQIFPSKFAKKKLKFINSSQEDILILNMKLY